jgi:hypothetical protein
MDENENDFILKLFSVLHVVVMYHLRRPKNFPENKNVSQIEFIGLLRVVIYFFYIKVRIMADRILNNDDDVVVIIFLSK